MITVVCFGRMREHLPEGHRGNRADVEVPENSTVADVTSVLGAPPEEVFAVLIDGVQAKLDEKVVEGSEVTLMPPFTGGAT
jgi:sulfur carrier protein ThiS